MMWRAPFLWTFLGLVWRDYHGRISVKTAWEIARIFHKPGHLQRERPEAMK